jgi:hypothetical protein
MKMVRSTRFIFAPLAFLLCILLIPNHVSAQTDFSGTWAFNQSKSTQPGGGGGGGGRRGGMMGGGNSDLTITQDGNTITVKSMRPTRDGQQEFTQIIVADGEAHEAESNFGTSTITAEWKEGILVVEETRSMSRGGQSMTFTTTSAYTLSADGKELVVTSERSGMGGSGGVTTKSVYDKK